MVAPDWAVTTNVADGGFIEPVRPFVSSTFRDMNRERDELVKRVFPRLRNMCLQRGSDFLPVDLRWGVTKDQADSGQVVNLCLDKITQTAPFFMCLLGERYGWHQDPSQEEDLLLQTTKENAAAAGHTWVTTDENKYKSVTELEINQAVFRPQDAHPQRLPPTGAYFYLRADDFYAGHEDELWPGLSESKRVAILDSDFREAGAHARAQMVLLKQSIKDRGLKWREYRTAEELGRLVLEDWSAELKELLGRDRERGGAVGAAATAGAATPAPLPSKLLSQPPSPRPPLSRSYSMGADLRREGVAHRAFERRRAHGFVRTAEVEGLWAWLRAKTAAALGPLRPASQMSPMSPMSPMSMSPLAPAAGGALLRAPLLGRAPSPRTDSIGLSVRADDAHAGGRLLLVLGQAGSGKSTALARFDWPGALALAQDNSIPLPGGMVALDADKITEADQEIKSSE